MPRRRGFTSTGFRLAQEEERDRLTHEALADVDAGRVIDHQAAQAWADNLSSDEPLPAPR